MSDNQFKKPDAYKSINHSSFVPIPVNTENTTETPLSNDTTEDVSWWNSIGGDKLEELMMTCDN